MLEAVLQKTGVNPADVGDVVVGSVLGPSSQRANEARIALFLAGFPDIVPVRTVNRQCSSGLQAVADVAAGIKAGYYDIGIAGGVETMSRNPMAVRREQGALSEGFIGTRRELGFGDCVLLVTTLVPGNPHGSARVTDPRHQPPVVVTACSGRAGSTPA